MVEIRLTKPSDGKRLEAFLEANNDDPHINETFQGVAEMVESEPEGNFYNFVALENGELVGALFAGPPAALVKENEDRLTKNQLEVVKHLITEVVYVIVKSDARRNKIGTALLTRAENAIKKANGLVVLFFDPAKPGLADFYQNNGYTLIPHGHGIAVQPPALMDPIGILPEFQAAYKTLKPKVYVRVYANAHVLYGVLDV